MRIVAGSLYALLIAFAMLAYSVDFSTMTGRHISQQDLGVLLILLAIGMIGFMFITSVGFKNTSKR